MIGIVIITSRLILNNFATAVEGRGIVNETMVSRGQTALGGFDVGFLLIIFTVFGAVIISSFQIRTNPAFALVSFLILVVLNLVAAIMTNAFDQFVTASAIVSTGNQYPIMVTIMRALPLVLTVFAAIVMIFMYGRGD